MASSTTSLETSANSRHADAFSFSTASFSELLSGAAVDAGEDYAFQGFSDSFRNGGGAAGLPKFKSIAPPSVPISPPPVSPSSYFAVPAGLSPTEFLDSPILLSSGLFPSPTTGSLFSQAFNWKGTDKSNQQGNKEEDKFHNEFSFQTHSSNGNMQPSASFPSEEAFRGHQQSWIQQPQLTNSNIKSESNAPIHAKIDENKAAEARVQGGSNGSQYLNQAVQTLQRRSEDGYNWRKYGQKQVKGSENPRSYYKCTYPNCPTKKKVERSLDGQITEIVYKGTHNHPKPQSNKKNSAYSQASRASATESNDHSLGGHSGTAIDSVATPENSSISFGDDDLDMGSHSRSGIDEFDEDEPDAKRWKEGDSEGMSTAGNRTVREPRVVVQTMSDIDILDDGYRWRKYGQKVVKGNPNPRSYYKCTTAGCPVRKHVERASHDLRAVITTYEGKHNHDVPAARGSGAHLVNRPSAEISNSSNNFAMAIRASATTTNHQNQMLTNSILNGRSNGSATQSLFTLEMLQNPGNYGFSGSGYDHNSVNSYMNPQQQQQRQTESVFSKAKEEQRDETFFKSMLC